MVESKESLDLKKFEDLLLDYTKQFQDSKILNYYIPEHFEEKENIEMLIKPFN